MWLHPEQLPHFVREARIESFRTSGPSPPTAARCGPAGRLSPHGAAPRCGLSAPRAATAKAGMPACGRAVRAPPRSIPLFAPENPKPVLRHPAGERKPHGARGAHRNGNAAGAHGLREGHLAQPGMHIEGGHRISTALIAIPCITTAESVRSNLIFSNRIRQRSSR